MIRAVWRSVRMRPGPALLITVVVAAGVTLMTLALAADAVLSDAARSHVGAGSGQAVPLSQGFLHWLLLGFIALAALVLVLSVMNAFTENLRRHSWTLTLLRALGAPPSALAGTVLAQAALIALLGAALGILGGLGTTRMLVGVLAADGTVLEGLPTTLRGIAAGLGLLAAFIGSLPPAFRTTSLSRANPAPE